MQIRKYEAKDLHKVLEVHKITMQDAGVYKGIGPWDDDLKNIEESYSDGVFLVGEIENTIIGIGAVRKLSETQCELKRMRIVPEFQKRGFGKLLLLALIDYAQKSKYREIILETSENQKSAVALYKKFEFVEYKKEIIDGYNCTWFSRVIE